MALKNIKVDKCTDADQIHARLLGEAREKITGMLTTFFVSSQATGKISENWRAANVVLIFKGSSDIAVRCRLVSLMSLVAKLLERILWYRISLHFE